MTQRIKDYVRYGRQLLDGSRGSHERNLAQIREDDIAPYLDGKEPLRILDLANGHLRPQYILLKDRWPLESMASTWSTGPNVAT